MITDSNLQIIVAPAQAIVDAATSVQATMDQQLLQTKQTMDALQVAQDQATSLQEELDTVKADDSRAQAAILSLTQQLKAAKPATVFTHLERNPWLIAPGTAANSGSVGNTAGISISLPTEVCSIAKITPAGPFADKYAYQPLGADDTLVRFRQFGEILFPAASDAAASQAFEFDLPQSLANGDWCNWGVQLDFADKTLRVWNKAAGAWVSTGVPLARFAAQKWVDFSFDFHRDSANNVITDGLQFNGAQQLAAPISFPPALLSKPPLINWAFQEDGNGAKPAGAAYSVAINNFGLLAWTA